MMKGLLMLMLCAGAFAVLPTVYASNAQHVHGTAELHVAIDGNTLEIELYSPFDNLLGFEHAPRNERQRRALQSMIDKFDKPAALFIPAAAAQCTAEPAKLRSPLLDAAATLSAGKTESDHAALEATSIFRCDRPDALSYIDVELFAIFPAMKRLKVQLLTPKRQLGETLTPERKRLTW
jgi:hypothetical protein